MKAISILLILFPVVLFSQSATFKEIKLRPSPIHYTTTDSTIIYPIVITRNKDVAKSINDQIRNELFINPGNKNSTETELKKWISEGLIDMSYDITYNNNGLISMTVDYEACGAYCSSSSAYFNFDLNTGKRLKGQDFLVEQYLNEFKTMVLFDKQTALKEYKAEELDRLVKKDIDSSTYQWAMEEIDSYCVNEISLEQFKLTSKVIEIMDGCDVPHAIQSETPVYELKYSLNQIRKFIKPAILNRLTK